MLSSTYQPLQPSSIDVLCDGILSLAQSSCDELLPSAREVVTTFKTIFTLFSECYKGYSGGVVSNEDIAKLGKTLSFCISFKDILLPQKTT